MLAFKLDDNEILERNVTVIAFRTEATGVLCTIFFVVNAGTTILIGEAPPTMLNNEAASLTTAAASIVTTCPEAWIEMLGDC